MIGIYIMLGIIAVVATYAGWEVYKLLKMDFNFDFTDEDS